MRFSTIILSTFVAALSVSAQNATTTTSVVVSGTAALTPAQSSEAACLVACPANDNNCRAGCIPQGASTNAIAECVGACPKGNGTATDNANYQSCVQSCINEGVAGTTAIPTATATGTSGSTASNGAASGTAGSSGGSSGSTASSTASAATTSKSSAADNLQIGASALGAAGLMAAIFAL